MRKLPIPAFLSCLSLVLFSQASLAQIDVDDSSALVASYVAPAEARPDIWPSDKSKSESAKVADFSKGMIAPFFPDLDAYVIDHLQYPAAAAAAGIEGDVVLALKLSATGEVLVCSVVESLGYGCDEAAVQVVEAMPRWHPAHNYGQAVASRQLMTVRFSLQ